MKEVWEKVIGYEMYEVSDFGRVKRTKTGKILKGSLYGVGYLHVGLYNKKVMKTIDIHKLVAIAFLDHTPDGTETIIDHKDNNPFNNRADNLQITNSRHNLSKDKKNNTSTYTGVSWCKHARKWKSQIYINRKKKHLGLFDNELDASKIYQATIKKQGLTTLI